NSLSHVLFEQGRYEEAASSLQNALNVVSSALRPDHPLIAIYSLNLAEVQLGRHTPAAAAAAELLVRDGLRIRALAPGVVPSRRRTLAREDWSIGATKSLLGAVLLAERSYDEAEAILLEARRDLASAPASERDLAVTTRRLVDLYEAWGKPAKAAQYRAR